MVGFCQQFYIACVESFSLFFVFSSSNCEAIKGNKYSKIEKAHTHKKTKIKNQAKVTGIQVFSSFSFIRFITGFLKFNLAVVLIKETMCLQVRIAEQPFDCSINRIKI